MTPERREEAAQAGEVFHLALAALGVASFEEALTYWQSLPESEAPAVVERWIDGLLGLTSSHRSEARDLAISYYRLARALHLGTTIRDPWSPTDDVPTLGSLRRDFAVKAEDALGDLPADIIESVPETDDMIVVEEDLGGVEEDVEDDEDFAQDAQFDFVLEDLIAYRDRREKARNDRERRQAEADAAALAASSSQKGTMDGGRAVLHSVERADERAIGYVRLSRTGDPCAWCRMLIGRGLTYKYGSFRSGTFRSDGEKYHVNCQCYAEPVFSEEQYNSDPRFALNREMEALWPDVTRGYSGNDAVNAWRRYWYAQSKTANESARTLAV